MWIFCTVILPLGDFATGSCRGCSQARCPLLYPRGFEVCNGPAVTAICRLARSRPASGHRSSQRRLAIFGRPFSAKLFVSAAFLFSLSATPASSCGRWISLVSEQRWRDMVFEPTSLVEVVKIERNDAGDDRDNPIITDSISSAIPAMACPPWPLHSSSSGLRR